jgi:phage baseplate assembly protein gpV
VSLAVTTPLSTFNGDIQVNGKINTTGDVVAGTVSLKTHKHGGVASGGSQTGTPV